MARDETESIQRVAIHCAFSSAIGVRLSGISRGGDLDALRKSESFLLRRNLLSGNYYGQPGVVSDAARGQQTREPESILPTRRKAGRGHPCFW